MATNPDNYKLFFIAGRIRSGTSLLNRILNAHEEVFLPQESPFIMHLYTKYHKGAFDEKRILNFYDDMWKEIRLTQFWKLDQVKEKLKEDLLALGNKATFEKLCKVVFHHQSLNRSNKNAPILGDKNPSYSYFLPELAEAFPDSNFVIMIRDVRDNITSCKNVSFDFNDTAILAERWVNCNEHILRFADKYKERVLLVRFEDLLGNPKETLQNVCAKVGLTYSDEMLNFHQGQEKLESWRYFYNRPLEASKISKWKKNMSEEDQRLASWWSKAMLEKFDYETLEQEPSGMEKLKARPKIVLAKLANWLESKVYFCPMSIRVPIIDTYRRMTGTL